MVTILCQAAFGAWTVTLKLWPQVVTAHLLGGFTTLSLIWLLYLRQGGLSQIVAALPAPTLLARVAFAVVVLQITLGGWVSSNYAALACYDFPSCDGTYAPPMDLQQGFNIFQSVGPNYLGGIMTSEARTAIHWVHRIGAIIVLFVVGGRTANPASLSCTQVDMQALHVGPHQGRANISGCSIDLTEDYFTWQMLSE